VPTRHEMLHVPDRPLGIGFCTCLSCNSSGNTSMYCDGTAREARGVLVHMSYCCCSSIGSMQGCAAM